MFRSVFFWCILLLSIAEVYSLRGALIRNGRAAFDERNGNIGYPFLFFPQNRGYQEFMRFGRSNNLPGTHQIFFRGRRDISPATYRNRGRRDDSDEAESARFG
uniref:Uncharacterized protein n=1 Tax=Panagrolaimus davidi TaxID=227884 RepID=A0A914QKS1_9BILA